MTVVLTAEAAALTARELARLRHENTILAGLLADAIVWLTNARHTGATHLQRRLDAHGIPMAASELTAAGLPVPQPAGEQGESGEQREQLEDVDGVVHVPVSREPPGSPGVES